jgi:hypothetical protein
MNLIYYIYYRFFLYYKKKDIIPIFSTYAALFVFLVFHFGFFLIFNFWITNRPIKFTFISSRIDGVIFLGVFLIVCYFLFHKNNKHVKIIKMFENEDKQKHKLRGWLILGYIALLFFSIILIITLNGM